MPASSIQRSPRRRVAPVRPLEELRVAIRAFVRGSERASLECSPDGAAAPVGVLREARRLSRELEDLIDYARAPRSRRVQCTAREIMLAARLSLPKAWRARLLVLRNATDPVLQTDGSLAARTLSRLLRNAFEAGSDHVLLSAARRGAQLQFSVLDRASGHGIELDTAPAPFTNARVGHAGLGLVLAWHEAGVLGGNLRLSRLQGGGTRAELRLRAHGPEGAKR
jgi:K+-sensing histidine kinase KdpD